MMFNLKHFEADCTMDVAPKIASEIHLQTSDLPQTFKLGELFAGAGGMALGAHLAKIDENGFSLAWANDIDQDACITLQRNIPIPNNQVYCCSVANVKFERLPKIDGLCFGFPCNDFSVVGERKGISGHFGGLYRWGVKALTMLQPSFFVAENVMGLSNSNGKRDLQIILSSLENAGYAVFPHVYKFEEFGVPQRRHRMIIVGFRRDLNINFEHPEGSYERISVLQALQNIPVGAENHEKTVQSKTVVERLSYIKPGENAFTANLPNHLRLNMKSKAYISQIYRRLEPDKPAYTVTGSGGGGTHIYHWSENRALTNRERARLQSFPDSYIFFGGKESVRKQIGMAVPPKGAELIFKKILATLLNCAVEPC